MKVIKEDSSSQGKKNNNKKSLIFMIPKLIIVVHFFLAPLEIVSMSKSHYSSEFWKLVAYSMPVHILQ